MSVAELSLSALAIAAVSATAAVAQSRDQVQIAGSSTVLPYANIAAEAFGENFEFPTPVVESGGSSAGLKRFCEGVGENTIDIANSSRQIREGEVQACADAGVTDIIEVRLGYDGIVFASQMDGPAYDEFTPSHWYQALAKDVPMDGAMAANPATNWADVEGDLPEVEIIAFIPGTKHGTREVFEEKVILKGCEDSGAMEQIMQIRRRRGRGRSLLHGHPRRRRLRRHRRRLHRDAGPHRQQPQRHRRVRSGVLREQHRQAEGRFDGRRHALDRDHLFGRIPVSRPLFFYVKKAHIGVIRA